MNRFVVLTLSFLSFNVCKSQEILSNANTIVLHNTSFKEICNALLDFNYLIEKKDNDLETVRTEPVKFKKYWNATYVIYVRVKDSTAYITGIVTAADGGLVKDMPIYNHTNKRGEPYPKSLYGYPFSILNEFALSFKKRVSYEKR